MLFNPKFKKWVLYPLRPIVNDQFKLNDQTNLNLDRNYNLL